MALGSKKKPEKNSGKKGDAKYVTIMEVLQGEENEYAKAKAYKGRLIWQSFGGEGGDDEENSTFYEVKTAFIGKPHENAPPFVLQTLVVNLSNPNAAEPLEQ